MPSFQAANLALGKGSSLRKQPKGYSGIDGARQMLNDALHDSYLHFICLFLYNIGGALLMYTGYRS